MILFLYSLDLKAMIAIMVRFPTVFSLDACLRFGDQRVVVQQSLASSASLGFSSASTFFFARPFSSFVSLAFFLRDSQLCSHRVALGEEFGDVRLGS